MLFIIALSDTLLYLSRRLKQDIAVGLLVARHFVFLFVFSKVIEMPATSAIFRRIKTSEIKVTARLEIIIFQWSNMLGSTSLVLVSCR